MNIYRIMNIYDTQVYTYILSQVLRLECICIYRCEETIADKEPHEYNVN